MSMSAFSAESLIAVMCNRMSISRTVRDRLQHVEHSVARQVREVQFLRLGFERQPLLTRWKQSECVLEESFQCPEVFANDRQGGILYFAPPHCKTMRLRQRFYK